jgi:hypothetical protein
MKTLVEFITLTKGMEYLIAIAFLFAFVAFWQFSQRGGKKVILRIMPMVVLALGIGALASTCAFQGTATTAAPAANGEPLLNSPVLVEMYGPATFNHGLHQTLVNDCAVCHHQSENTYPPCRECHAAAFNPENLNKPGIAHVYHLRCISCHIENQAGPMECIGCHEKAAVPPLSITHPLTGNGNCLSCHKNGISGVPGLPADHESATNSVCQLCHQPVMDEASMATRKLPHDVLGHEVCLMCHGEGIGDATRVPDDHAGRTDETCQACHKPDDIFGGTDSTPVSMPTATKSEEPITSDNTAVAETAPEEPATVTLILSHGIVGREACLMCHQEGLGDAAKIPDDHAVRTDETCQTCHKPPE